ncbi:MAG: acyl--CoA ligase [Rhodospirillaceae bacterium]|jgi:long-chain acyl-CoA synthetase|nr:acyl--CoA ligase [Rhodospirillaceae bacterium]MBT5811683.1 acyl--CoA ligase [Rhodospirillaceae bacterium]
MADLFNLGDLIDPVADMDKTALIDLKDPEDPREYSFRDIDAAANAVARGLVKRGFQRGDRIAILSANRMEFMTAYFGTMKAGLVSVPVNFKFPNDTIEFILRDADIKFVFTDAQQAAKVPAGYEAVSFDDPDAFAAFCDPGPFDAVRPTPNEVAMFLYTSGSTGRPKGVPLTHAGHLWVVEQRIAKRPAPDHRLIVAAPLYHMNALAIFKVAMAAHLSVVLLPQFTAPAYIKAVETYKVTWLTSVAAMMAMVAREKDVLAKTDLSSVRIIRMGSAPVSQQLVDDLRAILPNAEITNGYGTTEAGPVVYGPHPDGVPQPDISIGYPLSTTSARLVDGDNLDADHGVLHCRNPSVTPGYHNLPEKTAEAMTDDGWYVTGDVMRRDEHGFHYFVGRTDDMFNCGGENIYPSDVEKMLERHTGIEQACVVPAPDDIKGFKPIAFVVPRDGANLTEDLVKQFALENGPAYQHPRTVTLMDSLPLTGTNKVDRKRLMDSAVSTAGLDT